MPPPYTPYIPNAVDYLSPRIWTGFVRALMPPSELLGDNYLPRRDVAGDRLMWDILDGDLAIAPMVAVGSESPRMDAQQFRQAWADILKTSFKRVLREGDLRILRQFGDAPPNTAIGQMAAAAAAYIRTEAQRLSSSVDRRINWLQMNALQGSVVVTPSGANGIQYTLSYGVGARSFSTGWSDVVNADPLLDLSTWFQNLNFEPAKAIMTVHDAFLLQRNAKIRAQVFANVPTGANTATVLPQNGLLAWLKGEFGLDVAVTRSVYRDYTNDGSQYTYTDHKYLPDGTMIILPAEPVGYTAEAPAQLNNWQTGKYTFLQDPMNGGPIDPPETIFGCGWMGLPVIDHPDQVIVATLY